MEAQNRTSGLVGQNTSMLGHAVARKPAPMLALRGIGLRLRRGPTALGNAAGGAYAGAENSLPSTPNPNTDPADFARMDFVEPGSTRDWSALSLASDDSRGQPGLDLKRYLVAPDGNPGAGASSVPSASDYADSLIKVPAPINLASKSATNDQLWAMAEGGGPRTEGGAISFLQQRAADIAGTLFGDDGIDNSQQASLIESYSALGDANPLAYSVNPLVKAGADYVGRVSRAAYNDPEGAGWGVVSLAVNLGPDLWNYATDVQQLLAAGPWGQFGENNPLHIEPLMPALNDAMRGGQLGGTAATVVLPFGAAKLGAAANAVLDAKFVSSYGLTGIGESPFLADQALSIGARIGTPTIDAGVQWGQGIHLQGMPWEDHLASALPDGSRLPPNFKTFDYYDEGSGLAVSAKTLNTMSDAKLANPGQVYSSLKTNIDAAANFESYSLSRVSVESADIAVRQVQVAVPFATTFDQYVQIQKAIQYGQSVGVQVIVTTVH